MTALERGYQEGQTGTLLYGREGAFLADKTVVMRQSLHVQNTMEGAIWCED